MNDIYVIFRLTMRYRGKDVYRGQRCLNRHINILERD